MLLQVLFLFFLGASTMGQGIPPPPSTDVNDIRFLLWTREVPYQETVMEWDANQIRSTSYDPTKKTKIFVHGYTRYGKDPWIITGKDQYLAKST